MTSTQTPASSRATPLTKVVFSVAALALLADVVTKVVVVAAIKPGQQPHRLLAGLVYLQQARNSGAAFSVGPGATLVLTGISLVVVAIIVRVASRLSSRGWAVAFGLVLGGALGNLADRIFRAPGVGRGHVVDWISVFKPDAQVWPIFNLADSAIVVGGVLVVVLSIFGVGLTGRRRSDPSAGSETAVVNSAPVQPTGSQPDA